MQGAATGSRHHTATTLISISWSRLYPALVAPLSYALQSSELNGAEVADHLFWATSRVLDVFEGSSQDLGSSAFGRTTNCAVRSVRCWASRTARPSTTRRACGGSRLGGGLRGWRGGRRSRTTRSRFRPTPRARRGRVDGGAGIGARASMPRRECLLSCSERRRSVDARDMHIRWTNGPEA